jgi:hypothetical protein
MTGRVAVLRACGGLERADWMHRQGDPLRISRAAVPM